MQKQSNQSAGGLFQVGREIWVRGEVFAQKQKAIAVELGHNFHDLRVAQMLEDLPEKGDAGVGQIVPGYIEATEIHLGIAELSLIP